MATPAAAPPIIIIKKKVNHHGGHHGGAWKVAYADFVTAMMALFIVLWLMASSDQVKKSIAAYFLDPQGAKHQAGSGVNGQAEPMYWSVKDMTDLKERLQHALRALPALGQLKDQITMTITGEGLRIELVENSSGVFFESGNARPTPLCVEALNALASQLKELSNSLVIEGHTDALGYGDGAAYGNWELSSDRANEARRIMQGDGIRADQVKQVRGYADQNLRNAANPKDPANRRVSIIVLYGSERLKTPGKIKPVSSADLQMPVDQQLSKPNQPAKVK